MNRTESQTFLFTGAALESGHSVDFVLEDDVLLHIKPVLRKNGVVVNDRKGASWGKELLLSFQPEKPSSSVEVDLVYRDDGVEIGLAGQERQLFTRCGNRLEMASVKIPNSILELKRNAKPRPTKVAAGSANPDQTITSAETGLARRTPNVIDVYPAGQTLPEAKVGDEVEASVPVEPLISTKFSPKQAEAALVEQFKLGDWKKVAAIADAYRPVIRYTKEFVTYIGRARLQLGQVKEAVDELRWLQEHAPDHHSGLFYLGLALVRLQLLEEGRQLLQRCVSMRGTEAKYVFELARVTARLVNGGFGVMERRPDLLDDAIGLLTRAGELMLRDGRPHRDLSGLLLQKRRFAEALEALEEAGRRAPTMSMLDIERSRLLVRLDRIDEALLCARRAAERDPANDTAASAVRVLERWLAARRSGPFRIGMLAPMTGV